MVPPESSPTKWGGGRGGDRRAAIHTPAPPPHIFSLFSRLAYDHVDQDIYPSGHPFMLARRMNKGSLLKTTPCDKNETPNEKPKSAKAKGQKSNLDIKESWFSAKVAGQDEEK